MIVLAVRAHKAVGKSLQIGSGGEITTFADSNKVAPYAVEDIALMVKAGFIRGSGKKLNPTGATTRAEAATMLYQRYTFLNK